MYYCIWSSDHFINKILVLIAKTVYASHISIRFGGSQDWKLPWHQLSVKWLLLCCKSFQMKNITRKKITIQSENQIWFCPFLHYLILRDIFQFLWDISNQKCIVCKKIRTCSFFHQRKESVLWNQFSLKWKEIENKKVNLTKKLCLLLNFYWKSKRIGSDWTTRPV